MHLQVGTAAEAVACIKSGDNIFVQGAAATPTLLTAAMAAHGRANNLKVGVLSFAL
jgi:acyl-CoA hydrolase